MSQTNNKQTNKQTNSQRYNNMEHKVQIIFSEKGKEEHYRVILSSEVWVNKNKSGYMVKGDAPQQIKLLNDNS